jgi:Type II CAAX prenyl endopeptidase Rce1-like
MNASTVDLQSPTPAAPFARRAGRIAALGMVGVLSLLLQPLPPGLLEQVPQLAAMPPLAQRATLLLNPLVLLVAAALLGATLAHRVGLRSVLAGTAAPGDLLRAVGRAAAWGFGLGLVLAAADTAIAPHLGPMWQQTASAAPMGIAAVTTSVLYGGVAEEVMLRWGVMSLVAWLLVSALGGRAHAAAMGIAIAVAAGVFAAAHLPALAAQIELTPALIVRTLLINGVAGLLYGWLFWRRHLEAAMAAHAATHLGLAGWRAMFA